MTSIFLAPHNDDETLFGAYLLLEHQPHVIVCLRSVRMADPNYPGEMPIYAETRESETDCAMNVLGCEWTQWPIADDYPSGWEADLWDRMERLEADHFFAPAPELGGHQQHTAIGQMATEIFGEDRVTHYLTYTAEGRSTSQNVIEAPAAWLVLKLEAMACYQSQAAHPITRKWFHTDDVTEYLA